MNKRGQAIDMEVIASPSFIILTGVGFAAFAVMLITLKTMGNSSIMPWWVKIVTMLVIPLAAYVFTTINANS